MDWCPGEINAVLLSACDAKITCLINDCGGLACASDHDASQKTTAHVLDWRRVGVKKLAREKTSMSRAVTSPVQRNHSMTQKYSSGYQALVSMRITTHSTNVRNGFRSQSNQPSSSSVLLYVHTDVRYGEPKTATSTFTQLLGWPDFVLS